MREYPCSLVRVIDGNTIEAIFDLGFNITIKQHIRLYGVANTEESKKILMDIVPKSFVGAVRIQQKNKASRVMGYISVETTNDKIDINELLVAQGHTI
jgi:endonuclease YncB( thermonuclease family)